MQKNKLIDINSFVSSVSQLFLEFCFFRKKSRIITAIWEVVKTVTSPKLMHVVWVSFTTMSVDFHAEVPPILLVKEVYNDANNSPGFKSKFTLFCNWIIITVPRTPIVWTANVLLEAVATTIQLDRFFSRYNVSFGRPSFKQLADMNSFCKTVGIDDWE